MMILEYTKEEITKMIDELQFIDDATNCSVWVGRTINLLKDILEGLEG